MKLKGRRQSKNVEKYNTETSISEVISRSQAKPLPSNPKAHKAGGVDWPRSVGRTLELMRSRKTSRPKTKTANKAKKKK